MSFSPFQIINQTFHKPNVLKCGHEMMANLEQSYSLVCFYYSKKICFLSFITTFQTDFQVINKTTHKGDKNRLRFIYSEYHVYALISPFKIKLTLSKKKKNIKYFDRQNNRTRLELYQYYNTMRSRYIKYA